MPRRHGRVTLNWRIRARCLLDEIATLGLALQSKFLRVLEDRAVTRIGGHSAKKIDFRLIAATNEDLEELVRAGRFREDLYYRINVVPIVLPALRDRPGMFLCSSTISCALLCRQQRSFETSGPGSDSDSRRG